MSQNLRYQLWILLAAGMMYFTCLGTAALWDEDETWHASIAREMLDRNDWVVPRFNGELFPDKPPLMFWNMIAGFGLFGISEIGARFFSAIFGVAAALLTYHLGRRLFNERIGFWGGLIAASSIIFTVSARAATVDAALVCLTTAAFLCFVMIWGERKDKTTKIGNWVFANRSISLQKSENQVGSGRFKTQFLFIAYYALLGVAVLAKGPIGFLLPMAALGLFLMIKNYRPKEAKVVEISKESGFGAAISRWDILGVAKRILASFFVSLWQLRPVTGVLVTLAVALPWYVMVDLRTNGEWVRMFIYESCVRRFTEPSLGHSGPIWYYLPAILIGFFPWSVFLGPTCVDIYRRLREGRPWRDGFVLLCCLIGGWFVFWSICSSKLPHYVLPIYPALALLTACFLDGWIAEPATVSRKWMRTTWLSTIFVGLGMTLVLPIVAWLILPGEEWLGAIGLILVAGGWLGMYFSKKGKRLLAVRCYAAASIAFLTAVFGFATVGIDRHQNARPMMAEIHRDSSGPADICEYAFHRKSTVYYAGHSIALCDKPGELDKFLDSADGAYIITLDKYQEEIERNRPGEFEVFLRQPRFATAAKPIPAFRAKPSEIVVLKRSGRAESVRIGEKPEANRVN
jgi:4-amino-4-deoxy-L-arabinose transferase-like glycosyltransferase